MKKQVESFIESMERIYREIDFICLEETGKADVSRMQTNFKETTDLFAITSNREKITADPTYFSEILSEIYEMHELEMNNKFKSRLTGKSTLSFSVS